MTDVEAAVGRIEALLDEFGERLDARARVKAEELVQALMEVYGTGLRRLIEIVREGGDAAGPLLERMAEDRLVASLLLLHGLHPVDAGTRIGQAMARIERRAGGSRVEFLGVSDGMARFRVESGAASLGEWIEQVVQEVAPEIDEVEVQGLARTTPLVQIAPR